MPDIVFPQYPTASWQAKGKRALAFAVSSLRETGGNRLVPHERPRRDGAKHDDTGSLAKQYQLAVPVYTTCEDPNVEVDRYYPNILNELIDSFDVHEVGTLTLPTRGARRCRAASYERTETAEERDGAAVTFTFVEDNEDAVLTSSFINPSARSTAKRGAEAAAFSLASQGIPDKSFGASLAEFASDLEGLAGAPDAFMADLKTKAGQIQSASDRITEAFSGGRSEAGLLLLDPVSAHVHRQLALLKDTVGRVVAEKLSNRPRLKVVTFPNAVGLPQVAAKYQQNLVDLLAANPQLGNAFAIPPKTPINIYES